MHNLWLLFESCGLYDIFSIMQDFSREAGTEAQLPLSTFRFHIQEKRQVSGGDNIFLWCTAFILHRITLTSCTTRVRVPVE